MKPNYSMVVKSIRMAGLMFKHWEGEDTEGNPFSICVKDGNIEIKFFDFSTRIIPFRNNRKEIYYRELVDYLDFIHFPEHPEVPTCYSGKLYA